jgi:uncharacterized protein YerC
MSYTFQQLYVLVDKIEPLCDRVSTLENQPKDDSELELLKSILERLQSLEARLEVSEGARESMANQMNSLVAQNEALAHVNTELVERLAKTESALESLQNAPQAIVNESTSRYTSEAVEANPMEGALEARNERLIERVEQLELDFYSAIPALESSIEVVASDLKSTSYHLVELETTIATSTIEKAAKGARKPSKVGEVKSIDDLVESAMNEIQTISRRFKLSELSPFKKAPKKFARAMSRVKSKLINLGFSMVKHQGYTYYSKPIEIMVNNNFDADLAVY